MVLATPLHRRPGVTVPALQGKRQALLDRLHSVEHRAGVVTREYGPHDPRIAPFPACLCGAPARLQKLPTGKWFARCSVCERAIRDPQVNDWSACLQWCAMNLQRLNFQDLPLFDIQGLDPVTAKRRMKSIYEDLLLRSQIATLDTSISERTHAHPAPGRDYSERLFAYRDWAKLALQLLKLTADAEKTSAPSTGSAAAGLQVQRGMKS